MRMPLTTLALIALSAASPRVVLAQPPPAAETVEVRVVGPEGAALHETGNRCALPCELSLAPRLHRFGLELSPGRVRPIGPIAIEHPGLLRVQFDDRSGLRAAGWTVFATALSLGVAAGAIAGIADSLDSEAPDEEDNLGMHSLAIGGYTTVAVTVLVAFAVGLPLATMGDAVGLRFE